MYQRGGPGVGPIMHPGSMSQYQLMSMMNAGFNMCAPQAEGFALGAGGEEEGEAEVDQGGDGGKDEESEEEGERQDLGSLAGEKLGGEGDVGEDVEGK